MSNNKRQRSPSPTRGGSQGVTDREDPVASLLAIGNAEVADSEFAFSSSSSFSSASSSSTSSPAAGGAGAAAGGPPPRPTATATGLLAAAAPAPSAASATGVSGRCSTKAPLPGSQSSLAPPPFSSIRGGSPSSHPPTMSSGANEKKVRWTEPVAFPRSDPRPWRVKIGGLPQDLKIDSGYLRTLCEKYGPVLDAHLPAPDRRAKAKSTYYHRGYGFVTFASVPAAEAAYVDLNRKPFKQLSPGHNTDRYLSIEWSHDNFK